jgi:uncharacterized protein (DUF433 family)
MSKAFSMRMDDDTREALREHAARTEVNPSKLVNRYVKEGVRMDKHPAVAYKTTSSGRRAIVLATHPRLQVIDVVGTWNDNKHDVPKTAKYLHLTEDEVQAVLRYYADYRDDVDRDLEDHLAWQRNYERVLEQRDARTRSRAANG